MAVPSLHPVLSPAAERLAILAMAAGAFVMALNANVMAALLPYLEQELGEHDYGQLVGSAGLAGAAGAMLLGPAVDRFGRRLPMVLGMFVFTAASYAHVVADGFEQLLAARAVSGFAGGVVYTGASAAVADLVPYARRGRAMGVFTAGMFLGLPVGLPLAGVFAELGPGSWVWVYVVQAAIGVAALAAIWRFLPSDLGKGGDFMSNLPRLVSLEVFGALLSVLLYVGSFFTSVQFAGKWLDRNHLVLKQDQWRVWLVLGLCSAVGSLTLGRVADLIGKRLWTNITCVVVAACLYSLTFVDGLISLLVVGIPLAVISAARTGPFQALISELVPIETRGTLMGIRSAAVNLGTGVFPLLAFERYHDTLYLGAGGVLLAMLCVQFLVKKR